MIIHAISTFILNMQIRVASAGHWNARENGKQDGFFFSFSLEEERAGEKSLY